MSNAKDEKKRKRKRKENRKRQKKTRNKVRNKRRQNHMLDDFGCQFCIIENETKSVRVCARVCVLCAGARGCVCVCVRQRESKRNRIKKEIG